MREEKKRQHFDKDEITAYNMRFGSMAAEARNNGSANFNESCAAKRVVEAATASSRCHVGCNARQCGADSKEKFEIQYNRHINKNKN